MLLISQLFLLVPVKTSEHTVNIIKIPVIFSLTLPYFQLQVDDSGQVTGPCVKFSSFGILGLNKDVSVMTDCQYGGEVAYKVRYS